MIERMDFTYDSYITLIKIILSNGYNISNYHNENLFSKSCIIRHDIDMDIVKAMKFAKFELNNCHISSTYFLLISSCFYNLLSKQALESAYQIINCGHEIGLHFDEAIYNNIGHNNNIIEAVENEIDLLSRILGIEITVVSMHRPTLSTIENDYLFKNTINSYSKHFFSDYKYISDSRMNWHEDIYEIVQKQKYQKLHILSHPFWYNEFNYGAKKLLTNFINHAKEERYQNVAANIRDIDEFITKEEI